MKIEGTFPIGKWDFDRRSILADLPSADLDILMQGRTEHEYKNGEIIFREDTFPTGIFYIISGKAKKYKVDLDGGEQIIYVANKGEILGYHAVLSEENYPDSAAALENSRIAFIPRESFLAAVDRSDILSRRLLKSLSHEFSVMANTLTLATRRPVRQRLALQLVVVREKYKSESSSQEVVEINLSRDDLANLVGTARENVVRILTEFKEEGVIQTRGRKIIVRDLKRLIKIANYR